MNAIELIAQKAIQISAGGHFDAKNDGPVPSPCISVCRMAPDGSRCEGCLRTLGEIAAWSRADTGERLRIWQRVLQRAGLPPVPVLAAAPSGQANTSTHIHPTHRTPPP